MQEPGRNFQAFCFFAEILPDISSLELSAICGLAQTKCLVISVKGGRGGGVSVAFSPVEKLCLTITVLRLGLPLCKIVVVNIV